MSLWRQRSLVAAAAVGAALAALWWAWPSPPAAGVRLAARPANLAAPPAAPARAASATVRPQPVNAEVASSRQGHGSAESFERWMQERSSLQGAELDGDWGSLDASGRLSPDRSIRYRFDQLLTLQGEVELDELSGYVAAASRQSLGEPGGAQLVELWEKYIALLQREYRHEVNVTQTGGWATALQERKLARREALGAEWAEQFFGNEEREFETLIRQTVR